MILLSNDITILDDKRSRLREVREGERREEDNADPTSKAKCEARGAPWTSEP